MATLTEVSYYTRRGVKIAVAAVIVIILAPVIWRVGRTVYLRLNPPPPPPPTVAYGRLPRINFPRTDDTYRPALRLETISGTLPQLPIVGRVYVVEVSKSRLLELERVKTRARSLGFLDEPIQIDEQTYRFVHPVSGATLSVDVIYNSYDYQLEWALDQTLYTGRNVPNNAQAFLEAKGFWQSLGILASDLADGTPTYQYFAARPPQMIPTSSLSEANFVRVDMFRANLDELPVVTVGGNLSPVYVIFSGVADRAKRIIRAKYAYSKIIEGGFATYPLKTVDQAWSELQQGSGYVANRAGDQVVVRRAYLAYYESDTPQEFLQPVFVFEGDGGYRAYVPAIEAAYLQPADQSNGG